MDMDSQEERIKRALAVARDTKEIIVGPGASEKAPEVFKRWFPGRRAVVIVADKITWPVLGDKVYQLFNAAGIQTDKYIIEKDSFHAEWKYVEMVDKIIEGDFDAARAIENEGNHVEADAEKAFREPSDDYLITIAVGSGVINDLCKLCSFHHGQQYIILPTAASVDGFTSFGASISYHNSKQTFSCSAPLAVVADVDVIAHAPRAMTSAGYADLAAKIPAGGEWMIADFVGTEPIIPAAWHVLQDHLREYLSNPSGVASGDLQAVSNLFEGLAMSGIAMQAAMSSRPASSCDHLFSHILDMTGHKYRGKFQSHGFQVAIGTLTMCAVFDEFFKLDLTRIDVDECVAAWPTLEQEQSRALDIFRNFPAPKLGYTEVTKKYLDSAAVRNILTRLKKSWPELKAKLQGQLYSFEKMQGLMKKAGAPYDPSMIGVTRLQLKNMFPKVQLMRFRFNILDLAKMTRVYDRIVDAVFAPGGAWDLGQEIPIEQ